ncbi:hypothetical protein OKW29_000678 [Paraburkholderia sp. CI3]
MCGDRCSSYVSATYIGVAFDRLFLARHCLTRSAYVVKVYSTPADMTPLRDTLQTFCRPATDLSVAASDRWTLTTRNPVPCHSAHLSARRRMRAPQGRSITLCSIWRRRSIWRDLGIDAERDEGLHLCCQVPSRRVERIKRETFIRPVRKQIDKVSLCKQNFRPDRHDLGDSCARYASVEHRANIRHKQPTGNRNADDFLASMELPFERAPQ